MSKGNYARLNPEQLKDRRLLFMDLYSAPMSTKIAYSQRLISKALEIGQPALLYSGGRDSTVLMHLVRQQAPRVKVIHNDTTLGDPGALDFVRKMTQGANYTETTAADPWEMWNETGYLPICAKRSFLQYKHSIPGLRIQPIACCYNLKAIYSNAVMKEDCTQVAFWGNRAGESNRRLLHFLDHGFLFKPQQTPWYQCYPIQHWSDADVDQYLKENVPEFARGRGFETGCLVCMTDIGKMPNNASRLYDSNRPLWEKAMRSGFGLEILKMQGIKNPTPELLQETLELSPKALLKIGRNRHG